LLDGLLLRGGKCWRLQSPFIMSREGVVCGGRPCVGEPFLRSSGACRAPGAPLRYPQPERRQRPNADNARTPTVAIIRSPAGQAQEEGARRQAGGGEVKPCAARPSRHTSCASSGPLRLWALWELVLLGWHIMVAGDAGWRLALAFSSVGGRASLGSGGRRREAGRRDGGSAWLSRGPAVSAARFGGGGKWVISDTTRFQFVSVGY
jgi:hypothetical protein